MIMGTVRSRYTKPSSTEPSIAVAGVIHDDSKPGITTEVRSDGPLGLLLPASGPVDRRHRRIVPPGSRDAHPLIGQNRALPPVM